jgi:hypothetical protein
MTTVAAFRPAVAEVNVIVNVIEEPGAMGVFGEKPPITNEPGLGPVRVIADTTKLSVLLVFCMV